MKKFATAAALSIMLLGAPATAIAEPAASVAGPATGSASSGSGGNALLCSPIGGLLSLSAIENPHGPNLTTFCLFGRR
ncbi:hypothetical protein [Nocardia sp. NPDC050710]|uniref:hypothetical protein n=1 Tax=Nocardia sp. NPDC050710 TaxID=3157220 RepID=UPI0033D3B78F